jgi:hypothetical protein
MHRLALPVPELDDWLESGRLRERAGRGERGGAGARPILAVRSELPARYQFNGPFPGRASRNRRSEPERIGARQPPGSLPSTTGEPGIMGVP